MEQVTLGIFELKVLLCTFKLREGAYGASIEKLLTTSFVEPTKPGAVYATLGRLSEKGLIKLTETAPKPVRGGRRRNRVELSEKGRKALLATWNGLKKLAEGLK